MSILFHKKGKKVMQFIFGFIGILIILSMLLVSAPGVVNLF
jgi:hypothetical protein